jgi:putative ABC transport system permease protein
LDRRIGIRAGSSVRWFRVIGVAPDIHYEEVGEESDASRLNLYLPYATNGSRTMAFLVRTPAAPESLIQPVRDALRQLHAALPLFELMPMTERRRFTTWEQRFFGQMMGGFAIMALLLACVGVYAVLSYAARRRMQEIGVRLALGARPHDVVWLFVRQGSAIALGGLVVGSALAVAVARALSGSIWGVDALDLKVLTSIGATLVTVVLLASYWPARRASRADPIAALRAE